MNQNTWQDFNDAEQQQGFDLIPKGALVKVRMTIKPGDPAALLVVPAGLLSAYGALRLMTSLFTELAMKQAS